MISTETKEIWDQNREQLMHIGRDFKREIELDNLKKARHLRPNRSWIDLFLLFLNSIRNFMYDFTNLFDNLNEDEVIVIDSHDDIFKGYQIQYWRKDSIFDILPAIKWPSFKSKTKIFKTSEMEEMREFIDDQNHTKSIVIENVNEKLSINLVYGNIVKIVPRYLISSKHSEVFDKLKERYELWEIDDWTCKPKKIRVWELNFNNLKYTIEELERISNIIDAKFGMNIYCNIHDRFFYNYDKMVFNHSAKLLYNFINFIFTGDTLTVASNGNYYNFRLDQRTKKSEDSYIKGKI